MVSNTPIVGSAAVLKARMFGPWRDGSSQVTKCTLPITSAPVTPGSPVSVATTLEGPGVDVASGVGVDAAPPLEELGAALLPHALSTSAPKSESATAERRAIARVSSLMPWLVSMCPIPLHRATHTRGRQEGIMAGACVRRSVELRSWMTFLLIPGAGARSGGATP